MRSYMSKGGGVVGESVHLQHLERGKKKNDCGRAVCRKRLTSMQEVSAQPRLSSTCCESAELLAERRMRLRLASKALQDEELELISFGEAREEELAGHLCSVSRATKAVWYRSEHHILIDSRSATWTVAM
jgi:hypothetical protein